MPNVQNNRSDSAYGEIQTTPASRLENAQTQNISGIDLKRLNSENKPELPDFKKMFEKNESMMDQMTEDLMSLKEIMSAQNKLGLLERILLSAKMVKNVLMRNMELNKDYMDHTLTIDDLHKQVMQFQLENEDIRDRLSIMEALTGTDSYYIQANYTSIKDDFQNENSKNMKEFLPMLDQDKMIALIYEYNKENTILKKRIERFERKKVANKFMQINDGLNSTAYTTNFNNHGHTKILNDSITQKREINNEGDQSYALGYRCSTSPRFIERD